MLPRFLISLAHDLARINDHQWTSGRAPAEHNQLPRIRKTFWEFLGQEAWRQLTEGALGAHPVVQPASYDLQLVMFPCNSTLVMRVPSISKAPCTVTDGSTRVLIPKLLSIEGQLMPKNAPMQLCHPQTWRVPKRRAG